MKRVTIYAVLFVCSFAFAIGLTTADKAVAIPECTRLQCICGWDCSTDTGPLCQHPLRPYYLYAYDCQTAPGEKCGGCSQFNGFVGCCSFPN
jgi:hypothetical protein